MSSSSGSASDVYVKLLGSGSFAAVRTRVEDGDTTVGLLVRRAFELCGKTWECSPAAVDAFLVAQGGTTPSSQDVESAVDPLDISVKLLSAGVLPGSWVVLRRIDGTGPTPSQEDLHRVVQAGFSSVRDQVAILRDQVAILRDQVTFAVQRVLGMRGAQLSAVLGPDVHCASRIDVDRSSKEGGGGGTDPPTS